MIKKFFSAVAATISILALIVTAVLLWPLPDMPQQGVTANFIIANITIVDVESGALWPGQNVIVRDGMIDTIRSAPSDPVDAGLVEIDGAGKFLIPGLWDMHTHSTKLSSQYQHPLLVANGITGVRDLWGCMSEPDSFFACIDDRQRWNDALANHSGLSPRYMGQSSFQINGGNEVPVGYPEFFKARNADEARQLARHYDEAGADILKVYSEITPDAYHALAREARLRGLSLDGHRPFKVSLEEALAAGQRSIEHPRLFLFECYAQAADIRALDDISSAYDRAVLERLVNEQDETRCQTLMDTMAKSQTWWTPTLQVLKMNARAGDAAYRTDWRLQYIPYLFRELMWMPDADRKAADGSDGAGENVYDALYEKALEHLGQAHASGVKILMGTDVFDSYVFPGFSVHDELVEMVAAGLSPAAALRTATIDAAAFSKAQDRFGSIAEGKTADLILLDANPLLDISNTQLISGLMFNGQYFDRPALNGLLEFAEQRASSFHANAHIIWAALRSPLLRVQFAD